MVLNTTRSETEKRSVLGTMISTGSYGEFINAIFSRVETRTPSYVCFANVHMVVEAYHDPSFRKIINDASLVAPDGKPLSVFLNLTLGLRQDRVCGMDIFPDLLRTAEARGKSVYFYGTTRELLEKIVCKANKEFPNLKIAGYHSPPFRELTEAEKCDVVRTINLAAPDLVFVSLGCPKQERWMADNKNKIRSCFLGLGQAFKVYAGEEQRLPEWMRDFALEWAYRLYLEPKRLWKRYLYTNSIFILLALRNIITQYAGRSHPAKHGQVPADR